MLWQEDDDEIQNYDNGEVVDIVYRIQGKTLPVDYSFALYQAIQEHVPRVSESNEVGIYLVTAGEEGNGWMRENNPDEIIYLSRRTRLVLRIPIAKLSIAQALVNKTLMLGEHALLLKSNEQQALSKITTLYARHVALDAETEEDFLNEALSELNDLDIRCKKMLCGKTRHLNNPDGPLKTRSLMLADLSPEDAIKLQQFGMGSYRHMGCGLFMPHKSLN